MFNLNLDYWLLVVGSALGVIQIAAVYSGLQGLLFIRNKPASLAIGLALLSAACTWFVLTGDPGKPGDVNGVEGSSQFGLFLGGIAAATATTFVVASLLHPGKPVPNAGVGLEALRSATPWQVVHGWLSKATAHARR